jgi:uncharacterized protein
MKLLIWVLIAFAVLYIVRSKKKPVVKPAPPRPSAGAGEPMLRCAQCGVHLPASETVRDAAGAAYCSEEHRLRQPTR